MSSEDLLKMLDLEGGDPPPPGDDGAAITGEPPAKVSVRPHALNLDDWSARRGRDLLEESDAAAKLKEMRLGDDPAAAVADFHAAAFDPEPKLGDGCKDSTRYQFMKALIETPEYHGLHAATQLDDVASEIASVEFAKQFAELKAVADPDPDSDCKGKGDGEGEGKGKPDPAKSGLDKEMAAMVAVAAALKHAGDAVDEVKEAAAACGMGPGSPGSNDPKAIAALYKKIRGNPTLRRITELAGRFRRVAQSKQRRKVIHGLDDMVGVSIDGDVGRLLPHELVSIADPDLELDALRRLVERQMMCREYRAVEMVAKGPVIVTVDESGSMHGEKIHTAKAMALAMAWIARHQKRWCALVAYSGDSGQRLLPLPPGRWDEAALCVWLSEFIGCGSSLDVPVREMPAIYESLNPPRGKTDVVMITDAICDIPDQAQENFLTWKSMAQAKVISLIVRSDPGDLVGISDEVYQLDAISTEEEGVERCLSI